MTQIQSALTHLFKKHRIVFWYDVKRELRVYERDILFPLAAQRIEIDLDDGVKVNYARFGSALAKIPGLS
jgi:hypothetical protein